MEFIKTLINSRIYYLNIKLIFLLLGFFASTILSTLPSQTGDWGIIAGSCLVTCNEIGSKIIYTYTKRYQSILTFDLLNCLRVGIIYGFFVDAFKLGS